MDKPFQIASFCRIRDHRIICDGETVFESEPSDFPTFIKTAYKSLHVDYSKFFKMDNLSKLAFVGADILLKNEREKDIALVFSNKASSLDTDRKHQDAIAHTENFFPSPSVFVYTLPNICMGEISIKHSLYTENAFFVSSKFNPRGLNDYSDSLLNEGSAAKVLCGWVDVDNGKYDAFLYVVAKKGIFAHTPEELTRLYHTI